jgi:hypothetical protein
MLKAFFALLVLGFGQAFAADTYSARSTLRSVSVEASRFEQFLQETMASIEHSNSSFKGNPEITLVLENGPISVESSVKSSKQLKVTIIEPIYDARISYKNYGAPIESLVLDLSNYKNEVSIQGRSSGLVTALWRSTTEWFDEEGRLVGGFGIQMFLSTVITMLWLLFTLAVSTSVVPRRRKLVLLSALALIGLGIYLLPLSKLLAGFECFPSGKSAFLDMTFIVSVVLMVVPTVFSVVNWFRIQTRNGEEEPMGT